MCISNDKSDFVGPIKPVSKHVHGISSNSVKIEGAGEVKWSVLDTNGKLCHLQLPAYFVPKASAKLLSTGIFTKTYPLHPIVVNPDSWTVKLNNTQAIDIFINPLNNLPTSTGFKHSNVCQVAANFTVTISETHSKNHNLSEPQKEILRWHH